MSMFVITVMAGLVLAAACYSTRCSLRSGNGKSLPKEIAHELDPFNKPVG
ncbi:MAG: hypothetical protein R3E95_03710 [Thiolinea sp.]